MRATAEAFALNRYDRDMSRSRLRSGVLVAVLIGWPVVVYLVGVFDWMGWLSSVVYGYAAHCTRLYRTAAGALLGCGVYLILPDVNGEADSAWTLVRFGVSGLGIGLLFDLCDESRHLLECQPNETLQSAPEMQVGHADTDS